MPFATVCPMSGIRCRSICRRRRAPTGWHGSPERRALPRCSRGPKASARQAAPTSSYPLCPAHGRRLPTPPAAAKIELSIDADGQRYWNGQKVDRSALQARLQAEGQRQPQPEIHLRADEATAYRGVAETLADASRAGLSKIGFVSQPAPAP